MNLVSLAREHNRKRFDCGDETVNRFLREGALQDQEKRLSRTRVLIDEVEDRARIIGFHTVVLSLVNQDVIPGDRPRIRRKILVVLLAQIGVDRDFQGRNYGEYLLTDAELKVEEVGSIVGVRCLILDARSERLAKWYKGRDFIQFPDSLKMFKSLPTLRELVR